jgi:DNA repair photolyase
MLRRIENPPSRFGGAHVAFDEAPLARLEVYEDASRSILSRNDSPDLPFRWSVNPYRGCMHACAYCYARPSHEHLGWGAGTDFDTRILVKPDAPALLRAAFDDPSWQGERVLFSGNTDAWQPLEHRWRLTRACLEVCAEYRNPVAVISKNPLIARDRDVLGALRDVTDVHVTLSVPFADAALARAVEPGAPAPERRFAAMRALADAGLDVTVNIAPVIPGLNDTEIPAVLEAARAAGATRAHMILVRLPGPVADVFEERLREAFPTRAEAVLARIRRARDGRLNDPRFGARMRGSGAEWQVVEQLFRVTRRRLGYREQDEPVADAPRTTFRRPRGQLGLFDAR